MKSKFFILGTFKKLVENSIRNNLDQFSLILNDFRSFSVPNQYYPAEENFFSRHDSWKIIIQSLFFFPQPPYRIKNQYLKWGLLFQKSDFEGRGDQKAKKIQAFLTFQTGNFDFDHRIPDQYYFAKEKIFSRHDSLKIIIQSLFFFPQPLFRIKKPVSKVELIILKLQF